MGIFVRIKSSLDENKYLTSEIKESIINVLNESSNLLAKVDLDHLCKRLETLNIKASDSRVDKSAIKYDPFTNVLYINPEKLKSGNGEYLLASGLIETIAINDQIKPETFKAIIAAVNDSMTRQIAQGEDLEDYTVANIYTGLLTSLVGPDPVINTVIKNHPFEGNSSENNPLLEALVKEGIDLEKFKKTNNGLNYFHTLSINRPEAEIDLGTIENNVIDLCVTMEQLQRLENSGYIFFNFDERYTGLDKVKPFLEMKRLALTQMDLSKNR